MGGVARALATAAKQWLTSPSCAHPMPPPAAPHFVRLEPRLLYDGALGALAAEVALMTEAVDPVPPVEAGSAVHDPGREVAVIDTGIKNHGLLESLARNAGMDIIYMDDSNFGINRLVNALENGGPIEALHILSHGGPGRMELGSDTLSLDNLDSHAAALATLSKNFTEDADILIYGCRVGESDAGRDFIGELALLTQADVAASDDLTGAQALGGDWDLEVRTGDIQATPVFQAKALKDFSQLLSYSGTVTFDNAVTTGAYTGPAHVDASFTVGSYLLIADGATQATQAHPVGFAGSGAYYMGPFETLLTLKFSNNETFDVSSIRIDNYSFGYRTFVWSSDQGHSYTMAPFYYFAYRIATLNFTGITELRLTCQEPAGFAVLLDNMVISNLRSSNQAPTLSGTPATLGLQGTPAAALDLSGLSLADGDNDALTLTLVLDRGSFTYPWDGYADGVTEYWVDETTVTLYGLAADINTYLDTPTYLQYQGPPHVHGAHTATLTLSVSDGSLQLAADPVITLDIAHLNILSQPPVPPLPETAPQPIAELPDTALLLDGTFTTGRGIFTASLGTGSALLSPAGTQSLVQNPDTHTAPEGSSAMDLTNPIEQEPQRFNGLPVMAAQTAVTVDSQTRTTAIGDSQNLGDSPVRVASVEVDPDTRAMRLILQSTAAETSMEMEATLPYGAPLPPWLSFAPASGVVSGTPPPDTRDLTLEIHCNTTLGQSVFLEISIRFD